MASGALWVLWTLCVCFAAPEDAVALSVWASESLLEVVQGDFVVLPCSFQTSSVVSRLNVVWTLVPLLSPERPVQVIVFDHGQVMEEPSLSGRVAFKGLPLSADIVLNNTQLSDAGTYRCVVNNPPQSSESAIGELLLSVLAPPSLPSCQWEGDVDLGGSVSLFCSVSEGVPTPQIHWNKLEPEEVSLPVTVEEDLSGSVQIVNVSSLTSGLYRCSASNPLGTEHCYINLSVSTPPGESSGVVQFVLLSLSMSLLLAALMVLVLWLRRTGQDGQWTERKSEEEEECYNEIRYSPSVMKRSFV